MPGSEKPVNTIFKDTWYHLNFYIEPVAGWRTMGYLLAWLSHQSYHFGHPGNKGGHFYPDRNYVFNFSFPSEYPHRKSKFNLFEKTKGSTKSIPLSDERPGIYFDNQIEAFAVDTARELIQVKFKLLPETKIGKWIFSGYARDFRDSISNILKIPVTVTSHGRNWKPYIMATLIGLLCLAAIIYSKKRTTRRKASDIEYLKRDKDLLRVIEYIQGNVRKNITAPELRGALGFSQNKFHGILKSCSVISISSWLASLFPSFALDQCHA